MKFLNYIYQKLNLTNMTTLNISEGEKKSQKNWISISNQKTNLALLFIEIPFCIWQCLAIFTGNKNVILGLIITVIIMIITAIYTYLVRRHILKTKQAQVKNLNIYNRDLPNDLTPAHVRVLTEDGVVDSYTLASTILDLIDRGYLSINTENRNDIFTKNITLSITNKPQDNLFNYEKYLINWFFDKQTITSEDLKKRLNDQNENPSEKFSIFYGLVLLSFPLNNYYRKYQRKGKQGFYGIFIFIFIFILSIFLFSQSNNFTIYIISNFLFCYTLSMTFFANFKYLLNEKGVEIKDEYLDLKKYLTDFSLIDEKTSEMIHLWNFYLSYSVALGIKGVAGKEIENFFGEEIYNLNNVDNNGNPLDQTESQKYINEIDDIINQDKQIYQNKNI